MRNTPFDPLLRAERARPHPLLDWIRWWRALCATLIAAALGCVGVSLWQRSLRWAVLGAGLSLIAVGVVLLVSTRGALRGSNGGPESGAGDASPPSPRRVRVRLEGNRLRVEHRALPVRQLTSAVEPPASAKRSRQRPPPPSTLDGPTDEHETRELRAPAARRRQAQRGHGSA